MPGSRWFVKRNGRLPGPSSASGPAIKTASVEMYFVDGRLHRPDGAAIISRHSRQFFWRGVSVPEHVVMFPRRCTPVEILGEANAEVRRAWMEAYGLADFLLDLARVGRATIVHQDPEPEPRILWRIDAITDTDGLPPLYVQVRCPSTGRWYFLRVDPTAYGGVTTCLAAVASLWRRPDGSLLFERPEWYAPEVET